MFDWVLNMAVVLTNNHSNFEILKLEKEFSYTRVGYELTDKQKGEKDASCGSILFFVAVTAIYCINPSNVELFVHTFSLVRQKNGVLL